nr:Transposase [Klebsiella pneumoniae]
MLVEYPPTVQLSKLVNSLKAVTSRRLRNEFLDLREAYGKPVLWSRSYFVGSCGGAPLEVVKALHSAPARLNVPLTLSRQFKFLPPATVEYLETKDGRKWVIQERK